MMKLTKMMWAMLCLFMMCVTMTSAQKFNSQLHYMFMGCGSEENFGTQKMVNDLKKIGIDVNFYLSEGTAHEWLTWRRCFREFVPHLFK